MRTKITLPAKFIVVAILSILTLICFRFVVLYNEVSGELFTNTTLTQHKSANAKYRESDINQPIPEHGTLVIENTDISRFKSVEFILPAPSGRDVRMQMQLATEKYPSTARFKATAFFLSNEPSGQWRWYLPHVIAEISDAQAPKDYEFVTHIPEDATEIYVYLELDHARGKIIANNISLKIVEQSMVNQIGKKILLGLWIIVGLWVLYPLALSRQGRIVLLFGLPLLVLMLVPLDIKMGLINLVRHALQNTTLYQEHTPSSALLASTGHFVMYACVSVIAFTLYQQKKLITFGLLFALAATSEVLQYFASGRTSRIEDILVNVAGVVFALIIFKFYQNVKNEFQ